jgi:hypothetical protein
LRTQDKSNENEISSGTQDKSNENEISSGTEDESNKITEVIAYFKINSDLTINELYKLDENKDSEGFKDDDYDNNSKDLEDNEEDRDSKIELNTIVSSIDKEDTYKWSIDLSNLQEYPNNENFIFIAVSRVSRSDNDLINYKKKNVEKKDFNYTTNTSQNTIVPFNLERVVTGTVIYRLKINGKLKDENQKNDFENITYKIDYDYNLTYYRCECVSGIPRFIEDIESNLDNEILRKFIVLSFNGIYNFEYNKGEIKEFTLTEKFDYPKSIKLELEKTKRNPICMEKLITSLYDKYLLVEHYKDGVQALEGKYILHDM